MSFLHCRQVHQRSVHGKISPSPRMSQRMVPMKDNSEHRVNQPTGEDLHCKCCCDHGLEETMAHATGERAPAFSAQELEKRVDGVLPQYALLYGPPDQQVSAHQKIDIWRVIARDVRTLGVHQRRGTHCRKRWEDIRRWSRKTAEAQLGMASQRGRRASRTLTLLMSRILAVAYPDLDGRVRTSQQTQGASSGGGEVASEHEGAASHMAMAGHATESEFTSETEGEVQYSPLSSAPAFVLLVEEQEDNRWADVEFGFHAVQIPRGVYGGERFPFEMAVSAVFLSAGLPPQKRCRIGGF
ncbi:hypothetical protein NDU88_003270 [Pleurodeles waltl]|uniref:Myb/SANT-like DNA-binding domain-containing protein n=1 Tax=Pleurodeles waltl TaxID=8319 RepID=A0AAV7LMJ4_PLEWA|nr:hypothetical protein NDU88_003270 [Pleurodeles waltl]